MNTPLAPDWSKGSNVNEGGARKTFQPALWAWGLRGVVCAVPSGYLAVLAGCSSGEEIAAMVTGVLLTSVAVWWVLNVVVGWNANWGEALERALASAVVIKVVGGLGAALAAMLAGGNGTPWTLLATPLVLLAGVDLLTGSAIVSALERMGGQIGAVAGGTAESFAWTLAATLLQGAAVVGGLVGIAAVIILGRAVLGFAPGRENAAAR